MERLKQEKKEHYSKKIKDRLTPTKIEKAVKQATSKHRELHEKRIDRKLNTEIKSAMDEMAMVMKVAFSNEQPKGINR